MNIKWLTRRVNNMLIAAVGVRDWISGGQRRLQLSGRADEAKGSIRIVDPYGLAARMAPGGEPETVVVAVESDLRYALPPTDPAHMPDYLRPGEVALHDDGGQRVYLSRDGIDVVSPKRIRWIAPRVEVHASEYWLLNVGGYAEKLTHVSEGQLISETWHESAVVTPLPDHGYKHALPE